jgi:hypothetical protein
VDVGPVARTSALRWVEWAEAVLEELRADAAGSDGLPVLAHFEFYLRNWRRMACDGTADFRWEAEVDPDSLEFFTHALYNLDRRLAAEVERGEREAGPVEAHAFNLVLVRGLLDALAGESPGRAAFADQLRWSWPSAIEAR